MAVDTNPNSISPDPSKAPLKDQKKKKHAKKEEDLSKEDMDLIDRLELYVNNVQGPDLELQSVALERLNEEIRPSTGSILSIPKSLKYLKSHYPFLCAFFEKLARDSDIQKKFADILSVLAMTMDMGEQESLKYKLLGTTEDIGSWGHEYVRNLAVGIPREYIMRKRNGWPIVDMMDLVNQIVAFQMKHNAEHEAVDILTEVESIDLLTEHVDETNYRRTCLYLTSYSRYTFPGVDDTTALRTAYTIYLNFKDYTSSLRVALFFEDIQSVKRVFTNCEDLLQKKQFCYIIARHGMVLELDDEMAEEDEDREALQDIINNCKLSEGYLSVARDLEVMEPKSPEDIYKMHLIDDWSTSSVHSARQNLAATFVNAFVNAGFGQDKFMTVPSEFSSGSSSSDWIFKNKEHGKASAVASLGMISLWDIDSGLAQIDECLHSDDNQIVAGALLAVGIVTCGIKNEYESALALLHGFTNKGDTTIRIGAIMGLGIAYAGSRKVELRTYLDQILCDATTPVEVLAFTAISLGLIFVGSCNEMLEQEFINLLNKHGEDALNDSLIRFLPVALGLLFLGKEDYSKDTSGYLHIFNEKIRRFCDVILRSLAFAGTGDVDQIQVLQRYCAEDIVKNELHQGPAVLGIALVGMAEEVGIDMAIRALEHFLQYGGQNIRRAVPLALGLLCISNPKMNVRDTLSRLSHDSDGEVSMAAIISLGLIGAGTNNGRIAKILRDLIRYYDGEAKHLFCVRIAQGLLYLGKGLLTLSPYHSDRFLLSPTALAGLVIVLFACLDMKRTILKRYHFLLYYIVLAVQPRMLLTVDENLKPIPVLVRVGKAVDVVAQAGRPRTVTGFQTFTTPVILGAGERAELATEKYIPLSPVLEGFVIMRENPYYREEK